MRAGMMSAAHLDSESSPRRVARMLENMDVFGFELDADDMATLDSKTNPEAIAKFKELYVKCVVRDTPDAARPELAKDSITAD